MKGLLSTGEVVLIEHPAALGGGRPLRVAAHPHRPWPSWLSGSSTGGSTSDDGFLDIINDLVGWIVVILIVVSIVWLPIDLVRWCSRRYVLTNRRAMRMDGVLRKAGLRLVARADQRHRPDAVVPGPELGYADLTLYTASDTSNEVYEQLLDGLQFKKAVLDAKEAIRAGTPLQALAEDFVVKGGTNEASMRADGKLAGGGGWNAMPRRTRRSPGSASRVA